MVKIRWTPLLRNWYSLRVPNEGLFLFPTLCNIWRPGSKVVKWSFLVFGIVYSNPGRFDQIYLDKKKETKRKRALFQNITIYKAKNHARQLWIKINTLCSIGRMLRQLGWSKLKCSVFCTFYHLALTWFILLKNR